MTPPGAWELNIWSCLKIGYPCTLNPTNPTVHYHFPSWNCHVAQGNRATQSVWRQIRLENPVRRPSTRLCRKIWYTVYTPKPSNILSYIIHFPCWKSCSTSILGSTGLPSTPSANLPWTNRAELSAHLVLTNAAPNASTMSNWMRPSTSQVHAQSGLRLLMW